MDKKSRELVMAKLYFKNKDFKMAEKSFNEYLSMNPEDVAALKLLAQVYEQNKRYDKAFEMYERCYLAEPDRTGVLLDICRILLMNEIMLDHVDYRKWLNLAIKAFPSNPIVVNFKAFLSTLPEDQSSNQLEFTTRMTSKESRSEDFIVKILDKLSLMESRLERIENKLNDQGSVPVNSIMAQQSPAPIQQMKATTITTLSTPPPPAPTPAPAFKPSPTLFSSPTLSTSPAPAPSMFAGSGLAPTSTPAPGPSLFSGPRITPTSAPTPSLFSASGLTPISTAAITTSAPSNFNFGGNLFADSMKKLNLPAGVSLWSTQTTTAAVTSSFQTTWSLSTAAATTTTSTTSTDAPPTTNAFNFSSSNSNGGGNLFADSLKKLNLPSEGSWTTQSNSSFNFSKPKEDSKGEDDGEDGVVPNEELAIENTCDMEPIEIKTGEEDEDILFENRCKLFRLRDKEYKERGLGSIKVLKHKTTGKGRLIMRREAIGLVCLNCWDCSKIERVRENQIRWIGIDASDGEPDATIFLVKFKTKELTDTFMAHLTDLFLNESSSTNTSFSSQQQKTEKLKNDSTNSNTGGETEVELIDPKIDQSLVDKARKLQLPDLFYHKLKNQEHCGGCDGCEKDD